MNLRNRNGAVLIITLWILAILAILSVGIAGRMGLELKLTGFYRDNMKALYLAKAGIERAIAEKEKDTEAEKDLPQKADTLSESWANSEALFNKKNPFIISQDDTILTSYYTVKYTYKENKDSEGIKLYGMMDEASKININQVVTDDVTRQHLVDLLVVCGIDDPEGKVNALIDWIDGDDAVYKSPSDKEKDKYYSDIEGPYCKNGPLNFIEELLLVKGFKEDPTILYGDKEKQGIIDYITIHTDGKVNINTAPSEVLQALGFAQDLAAKIIEYRNNGANPGDLENQPIGQNDLNLNFFKETIQLDLEGKETQINNIITKYLTATSKTFRIYATGKVNKAEKHINCVVVIEPEKTAFKYWSEN